MGNKQKYANENATKMQLDLHHAMDMQAVTNQNANNFDIFPLLLEAKGCFTVLSYVHTCNGLYLALIRKEKGSTGATHNKGSK